MKLSTWAKWSLKPVVNFNKASLFLPKLVGHEPHVSFFVIYSRSLWSFNALHSKVWMGVPTSINLTLQIANLEVRELVPELDRLTTIEGTLDAYLFEIMNISFLRFIMKLP